MALPSATLSVHPLPRPGSQGETLFKSPSPRATPSLGRLHPPESHLPQHSPSLRRLLWELLPEAAVPPDHRREIAPGFVEEFLGLRNGVRSPPCGLAGLLGLGLPCCPLKWQRGMVQSTAQRHTTTSVGRGVILLPVLCRLSLSCSVPRAGSDVSSSEDA